MLCVQYANLFVRISHAHSSNETGPRPDADRKFLVTGMIGSEVIDGPESSGMEGGESGTYHPGSRPDDRPGLWRTNLREFFGVIGFTLVLAVLIKTFLVQAFFIPSPSMLPTLEIDDRVLVSKIAYSFNGPKTGDVIVFDSPFVPEPPRTTLWERGVRNVLESVGVGTSTVEDLIKRVVAVGGDRLEIRDNRVLVNGMVLDEPYLVAGYRMRDVDPFYVPDGHLWVMGDNRDNSQDSRRFGAIPVEDVVGRAFVLIWPPSRWDAL